MLLVLDTNEYVFAFGLAKDTDCEKLIDTIGEKYHEHTIRIPRLILNEVRDNLPREAFREFIGFISVLTAVDEDILVPFELGAKYEQRGLKPADAFIAAYAEWVEADALISENRHFLSRREDLPFRVVSAKEILSEL